MNLGKTLTAPLVMTCRTDVQDVYDWLDAEAKRLGDLARIHPDHTITVEKTGKLWRVRWIRPDPDIASTAGSRRLELKDEVLIHPNGGIQRFYFTRPIPGRHVKREPVWRSGVPDLKKHENAHAAILGRMLRIAFHPQRGCPAINLSPLPMANKAR